MVDPKKAGEEADRMIAELNQPATPAAENQDAVPPAITEPTGNTNNPPDVDVPAARTEPSVTPELALLQKELATANQRWNVLQGMINKKDSEIEQMRILLAQINQKQQQVDAIEQQKPTSSNAVTKQDIDDFGQDMIDLITKIASGVVAASLPQINARFEKVQQSLQSVGESTARTAEDVFNEALGRRVPDWEQINVDPLFLQSLQEIDPLSGVRKIDLLNDAYIKMDLARTARFFEIFKGGAKAEVPQVEAPRPDVTKLVSPGKSKATPAPQSVAEKVWSRSDISKLYEDQRNGRITQEEFTRQERDLFKAQSENRLAA